MTPHWQPSTRPTPVASTVRFPNVDPTAEGDPALTIHLRAMKLEASEENLTYRDAVKKVLEADPNLETEYANWSSNRA